MLEARLHGRGGQGTVRAADILVAAACEQGLYANAIPYFGFERRGAPVTAFFRIDTCPIRPKTQVYRPHAVVVLDTTLVDVVDVLEGAQPDVLLLLNHPPGGRAVRLRIPPGVTPKAYAVDASAIARRVLGKPIPNTAMLGAFAAVSRWVDADCLFRQVEQAFGPRNREAAEAGYELVAETAVEPAAALSASGTGAGGPQAAGTDSGSAEPDLRCPVGWDLYVVRTGDWRTRTPFVDEQRCNRCGLCFLYCPTGAIRLDGPAARPDLRFCKGCGICARECPKGAIRMLEGRGAA